MSHWQGATEEQLIITVESSLEYLPRCNELLWNMDSILGWEVAFFLKGLDKSYILFGFCLLSTYSETKVIVHLVQLCLGSRYCSGKSS